MTDDEWFLKTSIHAMRAVRASPHVGDEESGRLLELIAILEQRVGSIHADSPPSRRELELASQEALNRMKALWSRVDEAEKSIDVHVLKRMVDCDVPRQFRARRVVTESTEFGLGFEPTDYPRELAIVLENDEIGLIVKSIDACLRDAS